MPLYEYECSACGHRFEAIQKFSDPPVAACPKCAGPVHKMQSAPAFQFKGSGWYVTDYAKKEPPAAAKAEDAKKEAPGEKKDGAAEKTDSAAKTDAASAKSSGTTDSSTAGSTARKE